MDCGLAWILYSPGSAFGFDRRLDKDVKFYAIPYVPASQRARLQPAGARDFHANAPTTRAGSVRINSDRNLNLDKTVQAGYIESASVRRRIA